MYAQHPREHEICVELTRTLFKGCDQRWQATVWIDDEEFPSATTPGPSFFLTRWGAIFWAKRFAKKKVKEMWGESEFVTIQHGQESS